MSQKEKQNATTLENQEWIDSLTWIIENKSAKRAVELLEILQNEAKKHQVALPQALSSPYQNTISSDQEEDYPGDEELEEKILAYIRWNAMAMVVKANKADSGIGGHISSDDETGEGSPYVEGMQREIAEEVYLESTFAERCVGLINDDETEVGRVHLGIVHVFDLDEPKVEPREESIQRTGFALPTELIRERDQFETWSQICLEFLTG